ncbi:hypothetical protein Avbf_12178 [Armadillidium vulgare]|nr:hypothetical protein Avbf_12178 [Armadillidium vulgare]
MQKISLNILHILLKRIDTQPYPCFTVSYLKRGDDIRLAAKLCRERCKEILCKRSTNIGKHHVQLKASHKNLGIGKPDDVLIWTTSYEIEDSNAKVEETLTSTLHHPYVERAVSVTGKLSTTGVFKREAVLNFDIFEEPHHALQLYILKDYRVGGYILQVDLKVNRIDIVIIIIINNNITIEY